ncbi:septum site-determining protein MinC [Castellaniella sp.]|uniref:septum site-determining protein MinC n=1 Tax=Castellaniella sp. TaxID=1955812 RepID=UPI00355CB018
MNKTAIALDFKSATLHTLRAVLHTADTVSLIAALNQRMQEAGSFYEHESVVLDATGLTESPNWAALVAAMRAARLHPIGIQADPALQDDAWHTAALAPLELSAQRVAASAAAAAQAAPAEHGKAGSTGKSARAQPADNPLSGETRIVRQPLRSGQRIYARGCDLIVLGMVSQGAEVIADGHIHVYGPLRGKAMAGARGNEQAMILTTHFEPELLAIAGVYRVFETQASDPLYKRGARIELEGETLRIRALTS